jgi:hypothetical protein
MPATVRTLAGLVSNKRPLVISADAALCTQAAAVHTRSTPVRGFSGREPIFCGEMGRLGAKLPMIF